MEAKRYGRWYVLNGKRFAVRRVKGGYEVLYEGKHYFVSTSPGFASSTHEEKRDEVRAPMTGRVVKVQVEEGQTVKAGETLVVIEAMKMETTLTAPEDAEVVEVRASEGEIVQEGDLLVRLRFVSGDS